MMIIEEIKYGKANVNLMVWVENILKYITGSLLHKSRIVCKFVNNKKKQSPILFITSSITVIFSVTQLSSLWSVLHQCIILLVIKKDLSIFFTKKFFFEVIEATRLCGLFLMAIRVLVIVLFFRLCLINNSLIASYITFKKTKNSYTYFRLSRNELNHLDGANCFKY